VQDYAEEESQPAHGGKWIDVDLAEQTLSAYVGDSLIFHTLVSTGTEDYPTPTGTFEILDHSPSNDMTGPGYYLADVPNVMVFKWRNYAIHGTYWHDNFGQPMSHGCINMTIADSAWLYKWAPDGTPVIIHW
jgi:lipoprotein-anchoring transpeptidase ErfK/SrfK